MLPFFGSFEEITDVVKEAFLRLCQDVRIVRGSNVDVLYHTDGARC